MIGQLLLFCWLLFSGVAVAQQADGADYPPVSVEMALQQVAPHTWFVQGVAGTATENEGFISNAGFVVTEQGVVVIDALGTPSLAVLLRERIRTVTDKPVRMVITTHYHADHIYGLQVFKEEGATIVAPLGAEDYLSSDVSSTLLTARQDLLFPWVNEDTRLVPPDQIVGQQRTFPMGDVELTVTPLGAAHSEGDLAVLVEPDAVLFSGDIIFEGRTPFVGDADTRQWLAALERMEAIQLTALVPGHGDRAANPARAVARTRAYITKLREAMAQAVEEMSDFDEAYAAADWSEFEHLPAFEAANRRNAYQVYLAIEAEQLEQ